MSNINNGGQWQNNNNIKWWWIVRARGDGKVDVIGPSDNKH